jgi:hypothetical protein
VATLPAEKRRRVLVFTFLFHAVVTYIPLLLTFTATILSTLTPRAHLHFPVLYSSIALPAQLVDTVFAIQNSLRRPEELIVGLLNIHNLFVKLWAILWAFKLLHDTNINFLKLFKGHFMQRK